jgi:hypothetical protein
VFDGVAEDATDEVAADRRSPGPFAIEVGTKASPSRMKYAGGSCVVITDDDIGERQPGSGRLPS